MNVVMIDDYPIRRPALRDALRAPSPDDNKVIDDTPIQICVKLASYSGARYVK